MEGDTIPELREQLGRALNQLVELTGKLDDLFSVGTRVASSEVDIVGFNNSAVPPSPSRGNLSNERFPIPSLYFLATGISLVIS